jgi:hypothetical protein
MAHWTSKDGVSWTGPEILAGSVNLEPSYPCAIAVGAAVHVFAIHRGARLARGGPLMHWFSVDGAFFPPPVSELAWQVPGAGNGIAAVAPSGARVDAFAVTTAGLVRYSWNGATSLASGPLASAGLATWCVPAAASPRANAIDVVALGADGNAWRWSSPDGVVWTAPTILPRPPFDPTGPVVRLGFAAISPAPDVVEVFGTTGSGRLANWSLTRAGSTVTYLPEPPMALHDSVPAAVVVDDHLEVFAIAQPPGPLSGGALVRWRRDRGVWSVAVIDASLSAGGLAAAAERSRLDVFAVNADLQHWPAGIRAAARDRWVNWAGNRQLDPAGHCRPSTAEEVVAIVRSAEQVPDARVRAVGSSWSFTDIAMTPSFLVETNGLNRRIRHVIDQEVLTEQAPDARYLVHVEAGIKVVDLLKSLDEPRLAPFTLGGATGQTLAGVISTSVHGSNWGRGPIPDAVRAIQLVGPGGIQYWIEPDQWRITREDRLRTRLGPAVRTRYDDDWFDSVLVSMGSIGIITSIVLEVTDQYVLDKTCVTRTWSELRPQLADGSLFDPAKPYVMVAIDPAETTALGDRTCYVTEHARSGDQTPPPAPPGPTWVSDPLGAWCTVDIGAALSWLAELGLTAVILDVATAVLHPLVPFWPPGVPLPVGTALTALIGTLVAALKVAGPGAVGDFIGALVNSHPSVAAALVTTLTKSTLAPGRADRDIARRIMAPDNPGECAARGLAVELAFDTARGGHLSFMEEAMSVLPARLAAGQVLGGYIAMRFVGPSRAILSPQQSARTCMVEITGLRALGSTASLLDELEQMGRRHGAVQHWGMFNLPNLTAGDLARAYPRLDTWRRVRREITSAGTIRTFENDFSARVGLDAPAGGPPLVWQDRWRWCSKCMGMAFAGRPPGPCPAGGVHDHAGSGNYGFSHNAPGELGQRGWRWCSKCMGMAFGGAELPPFPGGAVLQPGPCPAGGTHDHNGSGEYTIVTNTQPGWRWCRRCQSLVFDGDGRCPAGGAHDLSASGRYWVAFESARDLGEVGWRQCDRCHGLVRPGGRCAGPEFPGGGDTGGGDTIVIDDPSAPAGRIHSTAASAAYTLPGNAPTAAGQAHWRLCRKCQTLSFRAGACFAGGTHNFAGSASYTVRMDRDNPQQQWRRCRICQGLWFSAGGSRGRCPGPAGVHDPAVDDYIVPWT